ncbi:uncharacterized protein ACOB7L_015893 [Callospermophilus lateralis]|uniref:uncharacterized protein LOC143399071 n=1 Tax=Callospermophilus lateralis TaxID=76772 RepID=UPI00405394BE
MNSAWRKIVAYRLENKIYKFHEAVRNGDSPRVKYFLARGSHVDDTDKKNSQEIQFNKVKSKFLPEFIKNTIHLLYYTFSLYRISNKTDSDDHCLTLDETNYKYYDKDIPKENGELPHTSNESKNDEETNETEEPKLETLPENCDVDIKNKNVIETTPMEEINIKNYHSNFSSSVDSKITGPSLNVYYEEINMN